MRTLSLFSCGMSSGVRMCTRTPSIVEASDLTCWRASNAGMVLTASAAWLSANARASSPVFHSLFQLGLSGAPTNNHAQKLHGAFLLVVVPHWNQHLSLSKRARLLRRARRDAIIGYRRRR